MIYYTADLHLGHANVIRHCDRPFKSVDEMDEALIRNWNSRVHRLDTVYIVGDLFFRNRRPCEECLAELKGRKHLITGNHDSSWMKKTDWPGFFESVNSLLTMKDKELSPYAPDRWIRELNRRYPGLWAELRKGYGDPVRILRPGSGGIELMRSVPDWCVMPTMFPFLILTAKYGEPFYLTHMDELMTMGSTYIWRCSKGVYRFAPEIYEALVCQPLSGNLPQECLYRMPEWAVYIETPGLSYEHMPMDGFIAHLDYNLYSRSVDLQFAIFRKGTDQPKMIALPLGEGTLLDAMNRVDQIDAIFAGSKSNIRYVGCREEYQRTFSSMLQLLLYLCSDEPDLPEIEHPQKRRTFSGGVRAPDETRVWDVGVRISAAIRSCNVQRQRLSGNSADDVIPGSHASPRPHVRSAHWHTYWTGPRNAVFPLRKPVMRWIPPLPIGMDWKRELPTNVRAVRE